LFVEVGCDGVSSSSLSVELSSVVLSRVSLWEKEWASVEWVKSSLEGEVQRVGSHWVIGSKS
jgi:hypothetical protein